MERIKTLGCRLSGTGLEVIASPLRVLDQLSPREGPDFNHREELACLEKLWLEKLQPFGNRGYNERKPGKDEMLRRMAAERLENSEDQQ